MAKVLALVIVGGALLGVFLTLWSWGWPKIKALWAYMAPWLLMYVVTRSVELFLRKALFDAVRSWYAALMLLLNPICYILPNAWCTST